MNLDLTQASEIRSLNPGDYSCTLLLGGQPYDPVKFFNMVSVVAPQSPLFCEMLVIQIVLPFLQRKVL